MNSERLSWGDQIFLWIGFGYALVVNVLAFFGAYYLLLN